VIPAQLFTGFVWDAMLPAQRINPIGLDLQFTTLTLKITSLYVAYAPELGVSAYGSCRDEALNNLADEIGQQQGRLAETGHERNSHAVN
jgi:hypothetical protein